MKRILWAVAAVLLTAAVLVAFAVMLIPRETLKSRMGEQIAAWTGRDVSLRGEPEIDFFPRLTVTLNDVRVGGPSDMEDAEIVSMERLTGEVRLLPLIIGRVEVGSFSMERPLIRLVRNEEGSRNWEFDSGAAALQLTFAGDVPLGAFTLVDGTIVYENRLEGISERFENVNLGIAWPSVRQPLTVSGSASWRGEQVTLSATAAEPFDFLNGAPTPLNADFASPPVTVALDGHVAGFDAPEFTGALELSMPSLRNFAEWSGNPIAPGPGLGAASVSGEAHFGGNVLSVENAAFSLDGNQANGALSIAFSQNPDIAGTLDFATLDLTPYFTGLSAALANEDDWRQITLDTDWFRNLQADVRLSAQSAAVGALLLGSTAASVLLKDARMEIALARAAVNGGDLAGALTLTDLDAPAEVALEAQLRARDLDLAQAAPAFGLSTGFAGHATIATDLASGGDSLGALVAALDGTADFSLTSGAMPLFGIEHAAVGTFAETGVDEPSTVTPVDSVVARLGFADSLARIEEANIASPDFTANATGTIGLADGSLSLRGTVQPAEPEHAPVAFEIDGSLSRPVARPLALAN